MAKLQPQTKDCPNIYSCIKLFSIVAGMVTLIMMLPLSTVELASFGNGLLLTAALQFSALLKAIYTGWLLAIGLGWMIYLLGIVGNSLIVWLTLKGMSVHSSEWLAVVPLAAAPEQFAIVDGMISALLIYGFQRWKKFVCTYEPARLSSQIRYHFLFNSLNTTVCLISHNSRLAAINLEELAELFRIMLFQDNTVSLKEELDTVKRYLRIEQRRLENRIKVRWVLSYSQSDTIILPALLLQPLVENAIYHGIEEVIGGGVVKISISTNQKRLLIKICNPINQESRARSRRNNSLAQANIEQRLAIRYGKNFSFIREQYGKRYCVTIDIPKEEKS